MNILIINGPNLNLLGIREPEIYGDKTYSDLSNFIIDYAMQFHCNIVIKQSNHEGTIIDWIHDAYLNNIDGIIINAGAYTHYSYAIRDAINAINTPTVEVHLSNILMREDFRKTSILTDVCVATFMGNHFKSYQDAIDYLIKREKNYE